MRIGIPAALARDTTCSTLSAPADVAGVDAHRGDAGVDRPQRQRGVEVDVGDHRQRRAGDDRRQRVGIGPAGHRHPDDLAARLGQPPDLRQRRGDVAASR